MGTQDVTLQSDEELYRTFTKALLNDVRALELMLGSDLFEDGVTRIGAEQEMFLVDRTMRPAPKAMEILASINDPRFVTELAKFNLEANLTPRELKGACLSALHAELDEVMAVGRKVAAEHDARILLIGILPTLQPGDLQLGNMTPNPRYQALNRAVLKLRGGAFKCHIKGVDELELTAESVMLEAANTSFQVHLQVSPAEFVPLYNVAQMIAAPVLAAAVNSPLLLGKRLWKETRVAVFQHSIDARSPGQQARGHRPRVDFGGNWVNRSILEIFHEDIARFRVVLAHAVDDSSLEQLARRVPPRLAALRLHNGTIYRWNRPCYGVAGDKAHLRIEARALPAGPSVIDEVANAAFFFGLMAAVPLEYGDVTTKMSFEAAKRNFFAAARYGLEAQFHWPVVGTAPAPVLIRDHLIPLAKAGLKSRGLEEADIDRYLGVLDDRVRSLQTGAAWALTSLARMGQSGTSDQRSRAIVAAALERQGTGQPVHAWKPASLEDAGDWHNSYRTVGQCMSTDLLTVRPSDLVDFAASLMDWERIRHLPVEDENGRLVGVVSHRSLLRIVAQHGTSIDPTKPMLVEHIMKRNPITTASDTPTLDAIQRMRTHRIGCLPVVEGTDKLIGIITEHDFINVAAGLLEQTLRQAE